MPEAEAPHLLANAAANADSSDEEGGEGAPGEGDGTQRPKKAKRARAGNATTLADSFAKIQVKELDLEFTVDPLFKKTSADFDEGGAAGLLMNHLSSDSTMRVVFDAGDAKVEQEDEDNDKQAAQEEGNERIDISKLKGKTYFFVRISLALIYMLTKRLQPNSYPIYQLWPICTSVRLSLASSSLLILICLICRSSRVHIWKPVPPLAQKTDKTMT